MQVKTLKTIYHDKLGKVKIGSTIELTDSQANIYLERGAVELYQTKVVRQAPSDSVEDKPKKATKKLG